MIAIYYRGQI